MLLPGVRDKDGRGTEDSGRAVLCFASGVVWCAGRAELSAL